MIRSSSRPMGRALDVGYALQALQKQTLLLRTHVKMISPYLSELRIEYGVNYSCNMERPMYDRFVLTQLIGYDA